ncbi:hypothetical protein [Tautonia sociabilis]|uniref:NfeD-like C-terminal domain-containing protein n=1 Tax=Tautonia sociabilis TaxID=2080755 RepID=A0A432MDN1_9BACT|nr:hypothetical protein [Tautonia sociabilis]RUL82942.1 hypothetical protein TsocGM_23085 [Tautonia sociabilis]
METFFLLCTIVGGTILVLQLALALLGFGGDLGGDLGDLPDLDLPDADADGGGGEVAVGHEDGGLAALGKKLTVQTVVAFVTFFGVGGLSAAGFGWPGPACLGTAIVVGLAATMLLAYAFGGLRMLQGSGSLRLENAVGRPARVYLRVPAHNGGAGKVLVPVQGRIEEIRAVTSGPELRGGESAVVTRVVDAATLEVVAEAAYLAKPADLSG